MAKLMLIGSVAQIEILQDPDDEELVLAKCRLHAPRVTTGIKCRWQEHYDTLADAEQYAASHADNG